MSRGPSSSPPYARRAGVLLIVLGGLAAVLGGGFVLFGLLLPRLANDPAVKPRIDELRAMSPLDPQVVLFVGGGLMLAYALGALVVGIGVRRGTRPWVIAATVFTAAVTALMTLSVLINAASGRAMDLVQPLVMLALHGLALRWLIGALTAAASPAFDWPVPPHRPMQEYYLPPAQPARRS